MSEEAFALSAIRAVVIGFCVLFLSVASCGVMTAGKDTQASTTAKLKACVDAGGSWIRSECVNSCKR